MTTMNVWESMRGNVSEEEAKKFWAPISPLAYIPKLKGGNKKILTIWGRYDPTFWPEFTKDFLEELRRNQIPFESMGLLCGHYSLGVKPFSYAVGYRFGKFLQKALRDQA